MPGLDEGDAEAISEANAKIVEAVGEVFGTRWGLRAATVLPALLVALFLYGGFAAHNHTARLTFLIVGIFWGAVVLGVLGYSVLGRDLD